MPNEESGSEWWQAPWQFLVHSVVGVAIFGVIAGAAVALDYAVKYLKGNGVNEVIVIGLSVTEYALFLADLALFLVFIWRTAKRAYEVL